MTVRARSTLSCLEGRHIGAGPEMAGDEKSSAGGTDPNTTGSDQQAAIQPGSAKRPQQNDMIDKMDESNKQGPMVDRWFDRQLNQLYSEVVSEPLPKEFLELIDKLREKTPTK
jgi:Anti-sigma factor NepR